ncbi:unnamed protein product [Paramecium sonneborni]|uniref:Transmembrane protein n=1 Tax=Paramecium sonneborni TaxID=65129 RepID=A0A8S1RKI3_9CILI|nr:unnamed protein product [Paramecium sonneborni]
MLDCNILPIYLIIKKEENQLNIIHSQNQFNNQKQFIRNVCLNVIIQIFSCENINLDLVIPENLQKATAEYKGLTIQPEQMLNHLLLIDIPSNQINQQLNLIIIFDILLIIVSTIIREKDPN